MNTDLAINGANQRRRTMISFLRKGFNDENGQTLPFLALLMVGMIGVSGLVVDVGRAYVVRGELQNSANAAALAAAGYVYASSSASVTPTTVADQYSATTGGNNTDSSLGSVTTTVTTKCLNILMPKGTTCGSGTASNAVVVKNTTTINTFFMGLFGVKTLNVGATAMASMQGSSLPWNVAIIIDSTGSMATVDSNCGSLTQFQCALTGVQSLLQATNPCPVGVSSCSGSSANVRAALFTFPNVLTSYNGTAVSSVSDDINCGGTPATWTNYSSQPIAAPYTLPVPGATLPGAPDATYLTYTTTSAATSPGKTWTATYQITPFLSDYYEPSSSSGLNSSSNLVKAVGYGSTSGCLTYSFGIWGTGSGSGFGNTYLAGSIYEAQAALAAEQALNGGQNAMIVLSDGDMNASYYSKNTSAYGTANSTNQYAKAYEFPSGPAGSEVGPTSTSPSDPVPAYYTPATTTAGTGYSALTGTGVYPDWKDQCQQAITAAQYATSHSTTVFSVAYGSGSSGCASGWNIGLTDTTLVGTGANQSFTLSTLDPCVTMENIASSLSTFYSDYKQGGTSGSCIDAAHSTVSLQDIFLAISSTFTKPRLIPTNAT
jgi:hypothetical protein